MEQLFNISLISGCLAFPLIAAAAHPCNAQTPAEAGLVPSQLVVAGFTPTETQLVLERLDDQDVAEAWDAVVNARTAAAEAQSSCLEARLALAADPANATCRQATDTTQSVLQSRTAACQDALTVFEALLFDQVEGPLLTELRRVRAQHAAILPPEMLALEWDEEEMAALSASLIEERRCQRREEAVRTASANILANARADSAVAAAAVQLQTYLSGVTTLINSIE